MTNKKQKIDPRFLCESGTEVFNGNELLAKGALETEGGVHLLTGYPGSPVATFFDVLAGGAELLKERGIECRLANNEALAVAAVNGTQMGPLRAMAVVKSVGLHVASDALALGNLAGPHREGGAVVVAGDDPWSESTQVPADSRFLYRHLQVPVIEPSTPQEIKDYVDVAFKLSRAAGLYVGYVLTTPLADGGGTVHCGSNHYPLTNAQHPFELDTRQLDLESTVLLPPRTGRREQDLPERFERLVDETRRLGVNRFEDVPGADEVLLVTSGMAYQYVRQALTDLGLADGMPVLKLAVTYPLDRELIEPLLKRFKHIVVIEERRAFIEEQLAEIALRASQRGAAHIAKIWGKQLPDGLSGFPSVLGLNVSIVIERLGTVTRHLQGASAGQATRRIDTELAVLNESSQIEADAPVRTPTFCPGCPHRDSSAVLLEIRQRLADERYMRRRYGCGPIDVVFHGDTGCYTMLMFEPNSQLMHNYSGMGLGGGTGSGIDPFITNKQVVFMGDSTFFHSGSTAISNAVASGQDITFIILDNGTTAMTGHQPLPSVDHDLLGRPIPAQDLERVAKAMTGGRVPVVRTNPESRKRYGRLLEKTLLADGVKIIIADKECGITYHRRRMRALRAELRQKGYVHKTVTMNVTPEVCEYCLECTNNTGCPGLTTVETDYGPKIQTDLSWCVNDGACARVDACPSFEEVIITRKRAPRPRGHGIILQDIPDVAQKLSPDVWRAYLAGVGGMGIGTATSILVQAGRAEGYYVYFSDSKGLAIRNGAVYSQIVLSRKPGDVSMTVGYGKADLLIGLDPIEATRAIDAKGKHRVASAQRTSVVVNTDPSPTIRALMGLDAIRVEELEADLRRISRADGYFSARVSLLCERIFGTKLYANITMLGIAYQRGLLPFPLRTLKEAIRRTVPADVTKNLRAFDVGRKLVSRPDLFEDLFGEQNAPGQRSLARTVREKAAYLNLRLLGTRRALREDRPGAAGRRRLPETKLARAYKHMVFTTLRACRELDRETMRDIAVRIYDLIQWGGVRWARRYVTRVRQVFLADDEDQGFAATRAVVWNLSKLMLIKDEFYVAALLTSYEKLRRDRHRYNINPANGDRLRYRRTFHPRLLGRQFDIRIPHSSLYLLRNLRFLRAVIPFWRHRERRFLRGYEGLVDSFIRDGSSAYDAYLEALRTSESVTGYAEVRWPKMEAARAKADHLLKTARTSAHQSPRPDVRAG